MHTIHNFSGFLLAQVPRWRFPIANPFDPKMPSFALLLGGSGKRKFAFFRGVEGVLQFFCSCGEWLGECRRWERRWWERRWWERRRYVKCVRRCGGGGVEEEVCEEEVGEEEVGEEIVFANGRGFTQSENV